MTTRSSRCPTGRPDRAAARRVCDDTNLPQRAVRDLANVAAACAAMLAVWDLTDVPVEVCIERDAARSRTVGP